MENLVDIVLGGVPKSGTSTLFNYLNDHREISGSTPKETRFLMDVHTEKILTKSGSLDIEACREYHQYFNESGLLRMDGSTQYFYQDLPLKVFSLVSQKPKAIFIFRDPARRILSSFLYSKNNLGRIRKSYSFRTYVDHLVAGDFKAIDNMVGHAKSKEILKSEMARSLYFDYLFKWEQTLGKGNIFVIQFEEMISSFENIRSRLSQFLGLDLVMMELPQKNQTLQLRNPALHKYALSLRPLVNSTIARKAYRLFNTSRVITKDQNNDYALGKLNNHFRKYINEYAAMGMDTDRWFK